MDTQERKKRCKKIICCYMCVWFVWLVGAVVFCFFDLKNILTHSTTRYQKYISIALSVISFCWTYFSFIFFSFPLFDTFLGIILRKKIITYYINLCSNAKTPDNLPVVALVVPVFNDFMPEQILYSFKQSYKNCIRYILDDSTDGDTIKKIDVFVKKHNVTVLRKGLYKKNFYKKNGLANAFDYFINITRGKWDFMCHIDSGDLIHHRYIEKNIPLFYSKIENLGIVTGCYSSIDTNSYFQNLFSRCSTDFSSPMYLFKTYCGQMMLPGAGTIYSAKAVYDVGIWPNMACEDGAMSIKIQQMKYNAIWSPIIFNGEMAVNSFRTYFRRMQRIASGTLEMLDAKIVFLKNANLYTKLNIFTSRLSYFIIPLLFYIFLILNITGPMIGYVSIYKMVYTLCSFPIGLIMWCTIFFMTIHYVRKNNTNRRKILYSFFSFPFQIITLMYSLWINSFSFIKKKIFKFRNPFIVTKKNNRF